MWVFYFNVKSDFIAEKNKIKNNKETNTHTRTNASARAHTLAKLWVRFLTYFISGNFITSQKFNVQNVFIACIRGAYLWFNCIHDLAWPHRSYTTTLFIPSMAKSRKTLNENIFKRFDIAWTTACLDMTILRHNFYVIFVYGAIAMLFLFSVLFFRIGLVWFGSDSLIFGHNLPVVCYNNAMNIESVTRIPSIMLTVHSNNFFTLIMQCISLNCWWLSKWYLDEHRYSHTILEKSLNWKYTNSIIIVWDDERDNIF